MFGGCPVTPRLPGAMAPALYDQAWWVLYGVDTSDAYFSLFYCGGCGTVRIIINNIAMIS